MAMLLITVRTWHVNINNNNIKNGHERDHETNLRIRTRNEEIETGEEAKETRKENE